MTSHADKLQSRCSHSFLNAYKVVRDCCTTIVTSANLVYINVMLEVENIVILEIL